MGCSQRDVMRDLWARYGPDEAQTERSGDASRTSNTHGQRAEAYARRLLYDGLKKGYKGSLYVHRLGNLTLLPPGVNSSLQDKKFAQKQPAYAKSPLYQSRILTELEKWNKKAVKAREDEILNWIESLYET